MVSVIVPCFNHGHFLEETIQSIMNSTYKKLEVIIVDDGSTDDSRVIASGLVSRFNNLRYLFQENRGPSAARNNGVAHAQGAYILPLDADDLIDPRYIAEAVDVLKNQPDVKVVYAQAEKFGAINKPWKLKPYSKRALAMDNMIYVSAVFRKLDWARVEGYTENDVLVREDWEFWIKILKDGGEVVKLPFTGFYYRIHASSRRKGMSKAKKNAEIDYLNAHYSVFFKETIGGPLRKSRSLSPLINRFFRQNRNS